MTDGAQHGGRAAKIAESVDSHRPSLTEAWIFAERRRRRKHPAAFQSRLIWRVTAKVVSFSGLRIT